jgi:hypothetical protein
MQSPVEPSHPWQIRFRRRNRPVVHLNLPAWQRVCRDKCGPLSARYLFSLRCIDFSSTVQAPH